MDHEVWKLVGGAIALIISMSTVYAIYAKSLSNKKSLKEVIKEFEAYKILNEQEKKDLRRDIKDIQDELTENEKADEKRDKLIEKMSDRIYDQK